MVDLGCCCRCTPPGSGWSASSLLELGRPGPGALVTAIDGVESIEKLSNPARGSPVGGRRAWGALAITVLGSTGVDATVAQASRAARVAPRDGKSGSWSSTTASSCATSSRDIFAAGGFSVVGEAGNGVEAVEKYKELKPDLVTMDLVMPHRNGIDATREIIPRRRKALVVMCSAWARRRW